MAKLTVQDLIEQGYYRSMVDMAERCHLSIKTVNDWKYKRDGMVSGKFAQRVADNARKELSIAQLALRTDLRRRNDGGKRWLSVPQTIITTELAPRVKSKALSSWILAHGVIGGYGA